MKRWAILACVLLAGLALYWWPRASGKAIPRSPASDDPVAQPDELPEVPDAAEPSAVPQSLDKRLPVAPDPRCGMQGRVLSTEGDPIAGVAVRWLALHKEDTEVNSAWPVPDWGIAPRESLATTSRADGTFAFPERAHEELAYGSVLIATHTAYWAGGLDLDADPGRWPGTSEIVLEPTTPIVVRVVDAKDQPQPGATVHHAIRPRESDGHEAPPRYARFLSQEATADASGLAELAPFRGEQALWAEKDALLSVPWQGPRPSKVVLRLGESFTVGGTVVFPDRSTWEPDYVGERRIVVLGQQGTAWRPLARLRGVQEGAWGPLRVPLGEYARHRVRLEGAPIVPREEFLERPPAGSHQRLDFVGEKCAELWFFVVDESEHPITSATAVVWWGTTDDGAEHVLGAAHADGFLYIGTFPPGLVQYRIQAPGYAQVEGHLQVPIDYALSVTLVSGGRILGRCTHDGIPVQDFEVVSWKNVANLLLRHRTFFGREDGSFELENLTPGDWSVYATSASFPSGPPSTVRVRADEEARIELDLPAASPGRGRVLDAETGEPLARARVQALATGGVLRGRPWGSPVPVAPDGTFVLEAFVRGTNGLTVECEGYAGTEVQANLADETLLDWGEIRLFRPQTLWIRLLGLEELGFAPDQLLGHTVEGPRLPQRHVDREGELAYEGVAPGDYRFLLSHPDGSFARLHLRLDPGREWTFEHQVAGPPRVIVRVLDERGDMPSFLPQVTLAGQEEDGVYVLRQVFQQHGAFVFEGVRAARAQVFVFDPEGRDLANREVFLGAQETLEVEIRLGEPPLRVHVVDEEGAPIPGAHVLARSASGSEIHDAADTDVDGWAELFGLPRAPLLLDVSHGLHGRSLGTPVDGARKEFELVLVARSHLELHIADGDEPLVGVLARIETSGSVSLGDVRQSNEQGRARFGPLGEGDYRIGCRRPDCWPALVDAHLGPEEDARVEVPMRRLADLELTLRNAGGLPVAGASVELRSLEFDAKVEDWIAAGSVRAASGLTTGTSGRLRVEGLPRGAYAWSVEAGERTASGSFELRPDVLNRLDALLPE